MSENEPYDQEAQFGLNAENDDVALIAALQKGNEDAFTKLYDQFYERVYYFAQRYVSRTDAQDITTEAFIAVWRKRTDFEQISSIVQFLFVTTRNRCYNLIKRDGYKHRYSEEMIHLMERQTAHHSFYEQEVRLELTKLLNQQVNQLPEKVREVFLLSFEQGLKPAEIATQLGVSVKTVKNQKLSAIKVLREALANHPLNIFLLFWADL